MNQPPATSCRSVFREGMANVTKEKYTQLWVTLINQMERSKEPAVLCHSHREPPSEVRDAKGRYLLPPV